MIKVSIKLPSNKIINKINLKIIYLREFSMKKKIDFMIMTKKLLYQLLKILNMKEILWTHSVWL